MRDHQNTDVSVTSRMFAGLAARGGGHLPQTQEEEESYEQSHHGDAVAQEVDDHSYLVVHLALFLQGDKKHRTRFSHQTHVSQRF